MIAQAMPSIISMMELSPGVTLEPSIIISVSPRVMRPQRPCIIDGSETISPTCARKKKAAFMYCLFQSCPEPHMTALISPADHF